MRITQKKPTKKIVIITSIIVIFIFGAAGAFYYYKTVTQPKQNKEKFGSETTKPVANQPVANKTQNSGSSSIGSSKDSKTDNDNTSMPTPSPDNSVTPATPVGVFVSNHHPNLSGSPAPNAMNSTCATTIGAYCSIEFKNGTVVKSLGSKQTDSNGNVTWTWKLQDVGLTAGTWTITAIAQNGSKTASASDPMNLEVKP